METVTVLGAGLAGSECAWQLAKRGIPVRLWEMKPEKMSPAHHSPYFGELVCSNSLRSDELTNAVGLLKAGDYIVVDKEGYITLTDIGREVAEKMYERHTMLTDFFVRLGVDRETATEDACKIEHVISEKSFEAMKNHILGEDK